MRALACGDCVVSFLLSDSVEPAEVGGEQVMAITVLAEKGLVPPLRYTS